MKILCYIVLIGLVSKTLADCPCSLKIDLDSLDRSWYVYSKSALLPVIGRCAINTFDVADGEFIVNEILDSGKREITTYNITVDGAGTTLTFMGDDVEVRLNLVKRTSDYVIFQACDGSSKGTFGVLTSKRNPSTRVIKAIEKSLQRIKCKPELFLVDQTYCKKCN